ncbi:PD-(D/E)XK nuclease family protein, partial [Aquabacterium sp. A7-Y]|uniref:PD-(D/E)XK nuclease family protein n=1 Tax=Aquabacterium sp. A7-Y TaxID=1349605 RepID=UPI00223E06F0
FAFIASERQAAPSLQIVLERERQARQREELNGLYVAMTRARERLVFSATQPHLRAAERGWWQRLGEDAPGLQPLEARPEPVAQAGPAAASPPAAEIVLKELPPLSRPAAATLAGRAPPRHADAARVGEAVHRALEWLTAGAGGLAAAEAVAAAAGSFGLDAGQRELARRMVDAVLASPSFRPFLDGDSLRWAGNEVALSWQGQVLRIDRLVQLDRGQGAEWWVLDYKLEHAPEQLAAYREQLARYCEAVRPLAGGAPVRAAFVTGQGEVVELDPPG